MAQVGDVKIRITAEDHFSPTLRRIRREMFLLRYGERIMGAVVGAIIFASGVLLGVIAR